MAIDPLGGGGSQCTTTMPVVKRVPSSTMPVPETPETSSDRRRVKVRIPEGARSRSVDRRPSARRSPKRRSTTGFIPAPRGPVVNSPPYCALRLALPAMPLAARNGELPDDERAPHGFGVRVADELVGALGLGGNGVGGLARTPDDLALGERLVVAVGRVVDRHVVAPGQVPVVELDREGLLGRDGQAVLVELLVVGPDCQRSPVGGAAGLLCLCPGDRAAERRP